jgi:hypothetical protein
VGRAATVANWLRLYFDWAVLLLATVAIILGISFHARGLAAIALIPASISLFRVVARFRPSKSRSNRLFLSAPIFLVVIVVVSATFFVLCVKY